VIVTGDPGVDSAAERVRGADRSKPPLWVFEPDRPRLVAGSTWPADEAVLLGAMRETRAGNSKARVSDDGIFKPNILDTF
jgi:3-deoxy-D-manno-octulosonic-acid transferase